jgi:hypothetical protein
MLEQAGVAATLLDTGVLTHEMRPHGMLRPAGFAAVGSAEALIHTYDVAAALGLPWIPAEDLTRLILDAVFPAAGPGPTADLLLHQTGRATSARTPWTYTAAARL